MNTTRAIGSLLLLVLALPASAGDLEALLRCNDRAVGGELLRNLDSLEYELHIEEPSFTVRGIYEARRTGEMRIDVFDRDRRVFSEWLSGDGVAWQLSAGAEEPERASASGAAALRHGLELPGRFWTLADMTCRGHEVEITARDTIDGIDYAVFRVTLDDGFQTWLWLNPETCLIERSRNFRAFHPDVDPEKLWTQSVYDRFEKVDGLMLARRTRTIDLATGETLGTTTLVRAVHTFRTEEPNEPESVSSSSP